MTSSCEVGWAGRLARALAKLAEVQQYYRAELDELRKLEERRETDRSPVVPKSDPSSYLRSFYCYDCWRGRKYSEERYAPLCRLLEEARDIVGEHPALAGVSKANERLNEFGAVFLNRSLSTSRLAIVAGLMCRAKEVGKDGFGVASRELEALLDLSLGNESDPVPENLDLGHHVSLFYGLRLDERFEIADDVAVVPLAQADAFVVRNNLVRVAPRLVMQSDWKSVGAIVKRFRWKPILWSLDGERPEVDWDTPPFRDVHLFFEDARRFIDLLAVTQGAPVVHLMDLDLCTDRRASLLFGQPYYHSGGSSRPWAESFGSLRASHPLDIDALDQAKQLFSADRGRYQGFGPIISRLSEALARTGQYAADDKILDVAIALEQMYELDQGEISFKLRTRAACFLESDKKARLDVLKDVKELYDARSGIVHRRTKETAGQIKKDAFNRGFDVARRSVVKLLQKGSPQDWNEVVMAGTESE